VRRTSRSAQGAKAGERIGPPGRHDLADMTGDMDPEAYRRAARRVADWVADYLRDIELYPVLSPAQPGSVRHALPPAPPAAGEPLESVFSDLDDVLLPATTHWQSPGFMAYFASSGSGPGILGETIAAALNVNAMLWRTAPAATELGLMSPRSRLLT